MYTQHCTVYATLFVTNRFVLAGSDSHRVRGDTDCHAQQMRSHRGAPAGAAGGVRPAARSYSNT